MHVPCDTPEYFLGCEQLPAPSQGKSELGRLQQHHMHLLSSRCPRREATELQKEAGL